MLQNYKAARRSLSTVDENADKNDEQVSSTDQSDSKAEPSDSNDAKENTAQKEANVKPCLSGEEEVEFRLLTALYETLSGYLQDYCHVLFVVYRNYICMISIATFLNQTVHELKVLSVL